MSDSDIHWQTNLNSIHLPRWHELPDIPIYMDQLVTLVERYTLPFKLGSSNQHLITSAMINNYVKKKWILPPEKKKYDRRHLAKLIIITTLKQSFDMSIIQKGIATQQGEGVDYRINYDQFCQQMEDTIQQFLVVDNLVKLEMPLVDTNYLPIQMATISLVAKLIAEHTIDRIPTKHTENEDN